MLCIMPENAIEQRDERMRLDAFKFDERLAVSRALHASKAGQILLTSTERTQTGSPQSQRLLIQLSIRGFASRSVAVCRAVVVEFWPDHDVGTSSGIHAKATRVSQGLLTETRAPRFVETYQIRDGGLVLNN